MRRRELIYIKFVIISSLLFRTNGKSCKLLIMKLDFCIFQTLLVGCLSAITTEYKYLQEYGNFPVLDILQCQLQANGNTSCAVRFNTTTTNGVIEEQERCEQLSVDWCNTGVLESGFTYVGKSVVYLTPPFTLYEWSGPTWEIWEHIPIAIKKGATLMVKFTTPVWAGTQVRMNFFNAAKDIIYEKNLFPNIPQVLAGVKSTVTAEFEDIEIRLNFEGQMHLSSYIGAPADIRILQFVFVNYLGDIHLVSYTAA